MNKSALFAVYNRVRHNPNVDKKRLNRALGIAQSKRVVGWSNDARRSLLIQSGDGQKVYRTNGACECADYAKGNHICKHRLARRLLELAEGQVTQ